MLIAVALGSLGVVAFYLTRSRNFGGAAFGMRWFAVFAPALALFAAAWIRGKESGGRAWRPTAAATALFALLGVWSIAGAAFGAVNPWAKFSWRWETSPLGMTGAEEAPPTLREHLEDEWKKLFLRDPFTRESHEASYMRLVDQHRRFYLQPTPWLSSDEREAFLRQGLGRLAEVALHLDEEDSKSDVRPIVHFWLGRFHVALGDVEAARSAFRTALMLRSNYQPALRALEQLPPE
jgi:hypothetical protein